MSALDSSAFSGAGSPILSTQPLAAPVGLLREMPRLLEYRAEADPDAEFIPKTIAGFAGGFIVMSACLAMVCVMLMPSVKGHADVVQKMATLMAFMLGVDCVASSLLLVGLKVRADHTEEYLFARHWLYSLGTGAAYATMIIGPWILLQQGFFINRFVAAAVWMLLMAFPAIAAKWTVEPHTHKQAVG